MNLSNGTLLQDGKYKIDGILGQGGFGITYRAEQVMLGRTVAIKEFFISEYCERMDDTGHVTLGTQASREMVELYRIKFLKEARLISQLKHPGIVQIHDIFEENDTAYYVMEYLEGESLSDKVKKNGAMSSRDAVGYITAVGKALEYIHSKHINHLDVKPNNIILCNNGKVVLIDFGVSKQYDVATDKGTTTTPVGISHGYSPAEQYMQGGVQQFSPSSDVYSLAATLYYLLTAEKPPEAPIVQDTGLPIAPLESRGVSQNVIAALQAAMTTRSRRTQTVDAFLETLSSPKPFVSPRPVFNQVTDSDATMVQHFKPEEDESKTEIQSEPVVVKKPEPRPKAKAAPKRESVPAPKSVAHEPKPAPKPQPKPQPKPELESAPAPNPELDPGLMQISTPVDLETDVASKKKNYLVFIIVAAAVIAFVIALVLTKCGSDTSTSVDQSADLTEMTQNETIVHDVEMTFAPDNSTYLYTGTVDDNGLPHGQGEAKWKNDGRTYKGTFEHGKLNGQGEFVDKGGNRFVGEMQNDTYYKGKMYLPDGSYFDGIIKDEAAYEGTLHNADGTTQEIIRGK